VHQLSLTDHVAMGEHVERYPYGRFPVPLDYPWYEPLTVLAAIAGATTRIRLSAGVLIAPLRPAVLLAKQLATLDVLSRGRVDIGLGTGWQREEFDASGVDFTERYAILDDQLEACRRLWSEAPVTWQGRTLALDRIHQWPRPVQPRLPIWLGLAPTPRNCRRIAEYGDGWIPISGSPEKIVAGLADIRAAFAARGRDFTGFDCRAVLAPALGADGRVDEAATFARLSALAEAGVTIVEVLPIRFCRSADELPAFLERAVAAAAGVALPECQAGGGVQPGIDLDDSAGLLDRLEGRECPDLRLPFGRGAAFGAQVLA
jgi:probable F420-dependent oxidoreductase